MEGGRQPEAGAGENRDVLARAIELHRGGALAEAEAIYRRVLAGQPGDPDALHYLGMLYHQRGRNSEAIELIQQAVDAAPRYADAYNNLGTVLRKVDRVEEAVLAYRRAIDLRPDDPGTLNNLGVALRAQGRITEGIALHRRAIDLAPRFANAHFSLGLALREAGDLAGAVEAFYKVIEITPGHVSAYRSLGWALNRAKRHDEAAAVFAGWLTQEPGNPVALHLLAACSGKDVPPRASDAYVEQVFDAFAESFDEHLRRLAYQAPQLAIDALAADTGAARQDMDVLDAGCGTGLCGPLLRPYARRLVGVDLSTGMLAQARGRGVYEDLVSRRAHRLSRRTPADLRSHRQRRHADLLRRSRAGAHRRRRRSPTRRAPPVHGREWRSRRRDALRKLPPQRQRPLLPSRGLPSRPARRLRLGCRLHRRGDPAAGEWLAGGRIRGDGEKDRMAEDFLA